MVKSHILHEQLMLQWGSVERAQLIQYKTEKY